MRQPKALTPLFLTELWERFGFYLIQSLLVLYLTQALDFSDSTAFMILGEYTALIYIAPLGGGYFSDRILGPRYSILIGAVFLASGYTLLGLSGQKLLFLSLAIVVIGNGLLKPNISSFLGEFYYEDDPRRDAGFTLFYIGINIGALLALGSSGFIKEWWGWQVAFLCAAAGMFISLGTFCFGFKSYENRGMPIPYDQIEPKNFRWMSHKISILILIGAGVFIAHSLLIKTSIASILQPILGIVLLCILFFLSFKLKTSQRHKLWVLIILILASVIFWGLFFQMFSAINLFVERNVDRRWLGMTIPAPAFISLESIFIVILGPLFAFSWKRLHIKKLDPTPGIKFSLAMFCLALAMGVLVLGIHWHRPDGLVSPLWTLLFYLMVTLGEMFLSPIGLSMVTELAPPHLSGFLMGVWFMSMGFGGELSGFLAKQASIPKPSMSLSTMNAIYSHSFMTDALLSFIAGLILLVLSPWLKRLVKS